MIGGGEVAGLLVTVYANSSGTSDNQYSCASLRVVSLTVLNDAVILPVRSLADRRINGILLP